MINSGSSSVKFACFDVSGEDPLRGWSGALERIGSDRSQFRVWDAGAGVLVDETREIPNHVVALDVLLEWTEAQSSTGTLVGVGHRVVHGGEECDCPRLVTASLERLLKRLTPLAPLHLPLNLAGIMAVRLRRPDIAQVAAFDTAFHHGLPRVARLTGLPRNLEEKGIRRYGFHGLSYEFILDDLRRRQGERVADQRIIVAHLGNGASMAAIKGGRSLETTMGFSTLAGLPMGTRSGDIDPGILLYLLNERDMTADALRHVLYDSSGLLGISGLSRNMADLLGRQDVPEAEEAIAYFCHHARRHFAGLTASLAGLDRVVFTGGIGANSPEVRKRICEHLDYLGISIDPDRNANNGQVISADNSRIVVEAVQTDEELVIARHTRDVLGVRHREEEAHDCC